MLYIALKSVQTESGCFGEQLTEAGLLDSRVAYKDAD